MPGDFVDSENRNPVHLFRYDSRTLGASTFWMQQHGVGEIAHWGDKYKSLGISNPTAILADAREQRFVLAHVLTPQVSYNDLLWTNTIIATSPHLPRSNDLARFMTVNDNFLRSLESWEGSTIDDALFITTARNQGEDLVTVYLRSRSKRNAWMAMLRNATRQTAATRDYISSLLKELPKNGRVYIFGDEISLDIVRLADQRGIDAIRRSGDVVKSFGETHDQLSELATEPIRKETTTFITGLPTTPEEVAAMGKPSNEIDLWLSFRERADTALDGRYTSRVDTREAFIRELTEGDNDAVVIFAHAEGEQIYIRGERVSFQEIAELPDRDPFDRRVRRAILISCEGANLGAEKQRLFRARLESLATILTRKNFFDEVIAPTRTINPVDGLAALQLLLDGATMQAVRQTQDFWRKVATLLHGDGRT
jgi:hypothetical protein